MIKIGLLAIVAVGMVIFIKQYRPDYAYCMTVCIGLFLMYFCFDSFLNVVDMVKAICNEVGFADSYLAVLLKIVGISYISEFCSGICKDAGYSTIGIGVETAGKFYVLLTGMPIFLNLIDVIKEYY